MMKPDFETVKVVKIAGDGNGFKNGRLCILETIRAERSSVLQRLTLRISGRETAA